jgi:D-alanine-D-alanine ligase
MSSELTRLTVAVLAGGRSSEHEISLSSGEAVRAGLVAAGHEAIQVLIGRDGSWRCAEEPVELTPGAGLLGADVAFPALHGRFGEDGTLQGMLETLDVAYVGAGVAASALCMDKILFKDLMAARGTVPQVGYVGVLEQRWRADAGGVLADVAALGLPVFVKPANLGSSMGIVKVAAAEELEPALEQAFAHDARVIVEAMAPGIEVECAVLGRTLEERGGSGAEERLPGAAAAALASEPGEISYDGEFYDFEAKYSPGGMQLRVPASISARACERVRELALEAFVQSGCEGLARVDFFVAGEQVLVNELNTMPGFTPTSVYAKLIERSNIPYPELLDRLLRLALERHAQTHAHLY